MAEATKPKVRYKKEIDGPRMRAYMAEKRAKDKAGYSHLTVRQYRKVMAESVANKETA
jgi:hypothetical protein